MSNLPPGVTDDMIPGNRPEDLRWEELLDAVGDALSRRGIRGAPEELEWLAKLLDERVSGGDFDETAVNSVVDDWAEGFDEGGDAN